MFSIIVDWKAWQGEKSSMQEELRRIQYLQNGFKIYLSVVTFPGQNVESNRIAKQGTDN